MKNILSILMTVKIFLIIGCNTEDDYIYVESDSTFKVSAEDSRAAKAAPSAPIEPVRPQPRLYFPQEPVTELAPFGRISGHTTTAFGNELWVIFDKQVWHSADGTNWSRDNDAPFRASGHSTLVFNNKLWLINGSSTVSASSVWRLDIVKRRKVWNRVLKAPPFPARRDQQTVVFDNKIWVIGGHHRTAGRNLKDVWNSRDGIHWNRVTANAPFSERWGHTATVFENKIWIVGGAIGGRPGDVWYSSNGVSWVKDSHQFRVRIHHDASVFDNKLWIIGGIETAGGDTVWHLDRKPTLRPWYWRNISKYYDINFHQRTGHTATTFKNKLWIIGGHEVIHEATGSELKGDIWTIELR
jgi:hypothetical protein